MKLFPLFITFFLCSFARAQGLESNLDQEVVKFFTRLEALKGSVYIDTVVSNYDTTSFKKFEGFEQPLLLIRQLPMQQVRFELQTIATRLNNLITIERFYKIKPAEATLSREDALTVDRLDSLLSVVDGTDKFFAIQEMVVSSTFNKLQGVAAGRLQPKLVSLLGIFESEKFYLFVYSTGMIYGRMESVVEYELILK